MLKRRPLAVVLVVAVGVALAGAGAAVWVLGGGAGSEPTPAGRVVDVPADRATDVVVDDHWSVRIPAGAAGAAAATLTVSPLPGAAATGATSLAAARLALSSGQPAAPWTFTYRLDAPLPADRLLYLVDDSGDGAAFGAPGAVVPADRVDDARVHAARMSPDRLVGTVTVDHLSFKQWLSGAVGALTHGLGAVFGQRGDAPTCTGTRPSWMSQAIFIDDENAPMRICTGQDPAQPDVAVVKVANNRGGALLLTAPAAPTWVYQSGLGAEIGAWPTNLLVTAVGKVETAPSVADRTWLVPPGQQVHMGFSRASLEGVVDPAPVLGRYTTQGIALGLVGTKLSDALGAVSPWWELAMFEVCAHDAGAGISAPSAGEAVIATAKLAKCALEHADVIVATLRTQMAAEAWTRLSPEVIKTANGAKGALAEVVAVAEATYIATDIATTLDLDPAALRINLFHDAPDGPMLVDDQGHVVPEPAATGIRRVYAALKASDLPALQRAYAPTADGTPWDEVAPLLQQRSVRNGEVKALRSHPGIGEDVAYNYSAAGYSLGFGTSGSLAYVTGGTAPVAAADPYGCLAADAAMAAGRISYAEHPCALHFQNEADPTQMDPDTPATRWALCHKQPGSDDAAYLVGGRARYCH